MNNKVNIDFLNNKAKILRRNVVEMIGANKVGHLGGSCSSADIVAALYFYKLRHDAKNPKMKERDRFLLSKGHSALIQYAALAECGYFETEELKTLKKLGSRLQGHPDYRKTPGVEANTGSLGQGLSIAVGMALGVRLEKLDSRVFVILGDGELAEGQIWEAAMAAANFKVDNLVAILDHNKLQATGPIAERFNQGDTISKWKSFGWNVIEIDGHNMEEIVAALDQCEEVKGQPTIIVAHTIKGKGISFAENVVSFHNGTMTEEQFKTALDELQ